MGDAEVPMVHGDEEAVTSAAAPTIDPRAIARLRRIGGDELLRRIVDLYLGESGARVDATTEASAAADLDAVEAAAHSLKSMAGNVGATQVLELAADIELAARRGGGDGMLAAVARLPQAQQIACEALERLGEGS
ncbi:MAG: Hpt domain-containing protein [Deltaproteobacteria bacterium]|nr:Hpt domain-containing protein [Deltaproteobacteria bacterium]